MMREARAGPYIAVRTRPCVVPGISVAWAAPDDLLIDVARTTTHCIPGTWYRGSTYCCTDYR